MLDDQTLRDVTEIALSPMLQQLILSGKIDAARRIMRSADGEAVPISADEWEVLERGYPIATLEFPPGLYREPPTSLRRVFHH